MLANVRRVKFYMYHLLSLFEEWRLILEVLITGMVIVNAGAVTSMLLGPCGPDMCWFGLCMDGSGLASSGS